MNSIAFYSNYYGHKIEHLASLQRTLIERFPNKHRIYLAGDSVLDNKHWILKRSVLPAINGYEHFLNPPTSVPDVAYWLNKSLLEANLPYVAINTAVEEASIGEKTGSQGLNTNDLFIKDNLTLDDIIIISLGGNDIALKPNFQIMFAMGQLLLKSSVEKIEDYTKPVAGLDTIVNIMVEGIILYIMKLTKVKPKKIIVTTLYYFGVNGKGWADTTLNLIGYSKNPAFLQAILRRLTYELNQKIVIPGLNISVLPLWKCLDGSDETDYVERVEPSVLGGEKIAKYLVDNLKIPL